MIESKELTKEDLINVLKVEIDRYKALAEHFEEAGDKENKEKCLKVLEKQKFDLSSC